MTLDLWIAADPNDVLPELLAVLCPPAVVSLEDRHDELLRPFQQIGYQRVFRLHGSASVVLPDVAVRLLEQLLIRVQLVFEEGLAQCLLDLTLAGLRVLPAREAD